MTTFSKPEIQYQGSVSDDVTTVGVDEEIVFTSPVGALALNCVTAAEIKLNDETNYHKFAEGVKFNFEGIVIEKIVVKDIGTNIIYSGLTVA
jgi:hypothetical protein